MSDLVENGKIVKYVIFKDSNGTELLREPKKQGKPRSDCILDNDGNLVLMNCSLVNGELIVPPTVTEQKIHKTAVAGPTFYVVMKRVDGQDVEVSREPVGQGRPRKDFVYDSVSKNRIKWEGGVDPNFLTSVLQAPVLNENEPIERDIADHLIVPTLEDDISDEDKESMLDVDLTPHMQSLKIIEVKNLFNRMALDFEKIKEIIRML